MNILPDDIPNITRESRFTNVLESAQTIYVLITLSNYPGALKPYYDNSMPHLIYFYPFLIFTVLILLPIPVAVVFEAFRINRAKILLKDRLKQKESLFLSFIILDFQKRGYIDIKQWTDLISNVYDNKHNVSKIHKVFENLDKRNTGYMNPEQFFQA